MIFLFWAANRLSLLFYRTPRVRCTVPLGSTSSDPRGTVFLATMAFLADGLFSACFLVGCFEDA